MTALASYNTTVAHFAIRSERRLIGAALISIYFPFFFKTKRNEDEDVKLMNNKQNCNAHIDSL